VSDREKTAKPLYKERVLPNIGTFAATFVFLPSAVVVSEPFDISVGILVGAIGVAIIWALLVLKAPSVRVSNGNLTVNQVSIPVELLGEPEVVTKREIFDERGPNLDSRAHKVFQGTVKTALKIPIMDHEDSTPYWLISSKKPEKFAQAIKNARNHTLNR
jgi:hypothetical protein